ncbi:MAG TPA: pyruvate dehydrogenase (acetyl-transferring) E1 component subunit alpha [Nanoarchaeota archaeon]|nr:pyruvate dehydrogenase (acetyl-transferring) E1 component subunit alpha [Nanoarchaeota archaeon]
MPLTKIAEFDVKKLEILSPEGKADEKLMPRLSKKDIAEMYRLMVLSRAFDEKAIALQRQGRLGTYVPQLGQEASIIGPAYALSKKDWLVPSFRETGAMIAHGCSVEMMMRYWAGDERGSLMPKGARVLPVAIPVSTQLPHAAGIAWGMKKLKERSAVMAYFGDGGTSPGDFHEAMNLAGVFRLPVVFVCQNNHYAISLPVERQTASKTIAQKAIGYGIQGVQVDGNDIFAAYSAAKKALEDAKNGIPTLIECLTYRMGDHTTSDDSKRYRDEKEVKEWAKKDPVARLEKYMADRKMLNAALKEKIIKKCRAIIEKAVGDVESSPPDAEDIFRYTYAEMDESLKEQAEGFRRRV